MAAEIDVELKNAFDELQAKLIDTKQKLKLSDVQIDALKRSKLHSEITMKEVKALPSPIKTYESVGRLFIVTEKQQILKNLQNQVDVCNEKVQKLENGKIYLEKNLKTSKNNLREMVKQRKEAPQKAS